MHILDVMVKPVTEMSIAELCDALVEVAWVLEAVAFTHGDDRIAGEIDARASLLIAELDQRIEALTAA